MNHLPIEILSFQPSHQLAIDKMLNGIATEFPENIFSPAYKKIVDLYAFADRYYWVAMAGDIVVGTVGIIIVDGYAVLKAMFLDRSHRGGHQKAAQRLLQKAVQQAVQCSADAIWLGTMEQFKAAQRFYEKNGFVRVEAGLLPMDYPGNDMDTVFYKLGLK